MSYSFDFDSMIVGHEFDFYGVDGHQFKLGIGDFTFVLEAMEDPSDGYRSYLDCIQISEPNGIFFASPLAKVFIQAVKEPDSQLTPFEDDKSGYSLIDCGDNLLHSWLEFGTRNFNDYYPYFYFRYSPLKDQVLT